MADQLKDYIDSMKKSGYPDTQIQDALKKAGWKTEDYIKFFSPQQQAPIPPQASKAPPQEKPAEPKIDNGPQAGNKKTEQPAAQKTSKLAICAFILSFLLAPIGILLGIVAAVRITQKKQKGLGFAIASILVGIIMCFVSGLALLALAGVIMQGAMQDQLDAIEEQMQDGNPQELNSTSLSGGVIGCGKNVDVSILMRQDNQMICYTSTDGQGMFYIALDNNGMGDISDFRFTAVSEIINQTMSGIGSLDKGQVLMLKIPYTQQGPIISFELDPLIEGGGRGLVACSIPSLKWENESLKQLQDCSLTEWDDNEWEAKS